MATLICRLFAEQTNEIWSSYLHSDYYKNCIRNLENSNSRGDYREPEPMKGTQNNSLSLDKCSTKIK